MPARSGTLRALIMDMSPKSASSNAASPQSSQDRAHAEPPVDPTSQSPDAPIEFEKDDAVARGNEERANAEPEPAALHDAQVPGKPDMAERRREIEKREGTND